MKLIEITEILEFSPMHVRKLIINAERISTMVVREPSTTKKEIPYTLLTYETRADYHQQLRAMESIEELAMLCGVTIKRLGK